MGISSGTRLGPYQVVAPLGAGGMGEVYRARDTRLGRDVAVKVLPQHLSSSPEVRARFKREAKTISGLNHPHICVLHDVGREGDTDYLVMELIEGETLAKRLARGALPASEVLKLGIQIADALDLAHGAGVIHRDLKPSNLMLTKSGAKLMDFGLARAAVRAGRAGGDEVTATASGKSPKSREPITAKGTIVGTVQYMAPEQLEGKEADARSDLWALGCVLYEMATGKRAFEGSTQASLISAIMRDQPRVMAELAPMTPPALEQAVMRCLAKDPDDRWQTANDLRQELLSLGEAGSAPSTRKGKSLLRSRRPVLASVALLVLLLVVGVAFWMRNSRQPPRPDNAAAVTKFQLLVADFDGPLSDPQLLVAARQLVAAALDQSDVFESVPRDAIKLALDAAGKPDTTHVDGTLARELAFRNGIKVTVEGRIDRVGRTFSVLLVARDADDGRVLRSISGIAPTEEALIPTLGHLTQQLRRKLGEKPNALALSGPRWLAATPSFEAYRKYAEAFEMQQMRGDDRGSLLLLREALHIDPDFAEAWAFKHFAHLHLGEMDSANIALGEALKRPQRLTEEERMYLQGMQDQRRGNLASAEATFRELIRRGYQPSSSLGDHGMVLKLAGRYQEALNDFGRAAHISPFGPQQWVLRHEMDLLLMFGKIAEARDEAQHLKGWYADYGQLGLAVAADNWLQADSLAVAFDRDPSRLAEVRIAAILVRTALAASKGSIREARTLLARAQSRAETSNNVNSLGMCLEMRILLDAVAGSIRDQLSTDSASGHSADESAIRGLSAAQRGELGRAKKALERRTAQTPTRQRHTGDDLSVLEAYIIGCEGRWGEAAAVLAPAARLGELPDSDLSPILLRWLAAQAFERSQQPDSATVYYELALDPTGLYWERRCLLRSNLNADSGGM